MSPFISEDDFTQDEDHGSRRAGPGIGAIGKPYRGKQRRMTPYNEDSFSVSFESMSIGTQFSDSSNEGNIFPPYTMSYGQPSSLALGSIGEEYGMINYPHDSQMPFQIPCQMQQGFQMSMWMNPNFLSIEKLWVGVKTLMHGLFKVTINIIGPPCLGMNIVFIKMRSLHQIM